MGIGAVVVAVLTELLFAATRWGQSYGPNLTITLAGLAVGLLFVQSWIDRVQRRALEPAVRHATDLGLRTVREAEIIVRVVLASYKRQTGEALDNTPVNFARAMQRVDLQGSAALYPPRTVQQAIVDLYRQLKANYEFASHSIAGHCPSDLASAVQDLMGTRYGAPFLAFCDVASMGKVSWNEKGGLTAKAFAEGVSQASESASRYSTALRQA
jgi:hypothetical protein